MRYDKKTMEGSHFKAPCPCCGRSVRGLRGAVNSCECGALLRRFDCGEWGIMAEKRRESKTNDGTNFKMSKNHLGDLEPLGAKVSLWGSRDKFTARQRLAEIVFQRYLFQYFGELQSGQTGWGIDFHGWLEISKGWKHLGSGEFEKVPVIDE